MATGIESVDEVLQGGLPVGAISELVGPECSGRTSLALSFLARMTQASKVCTWVDISDTLDPPSAAALQEARLNQREVSEKLGFSHSFLSKCETGERRIDVMELLQLANLYKKNPDFFLNGQ